MQAHAIGRCALLLLVRMKQYAMHYVSHNLRTELKTLTAMLLLLYRQSHNLGSSGQCNTSTLTPYPLSHQLPLQTLLEERAPTPRKLHTRLQARNLILILRHHIRLNRILPRWNLLRQIHLFHKLNLALLQRALEVYFLDGLAEIGGLADDGDEAVLYGEVDLGAFFDVFGEDAFGGYGEGFAAVWGVSSGGGWEGRVLWVMGLTREVGLGRGLRS